MAAVDVEAKSVGHASRLDMLLEDPDHDCYYFVDTNIIIAYHKNESPSLKRYIDHLSQKGPRFFVTHRIAAEFTLAPIPPVFQVFHEADAVVRADLAYFDILAAFRLRPTSNKFHTDVRWVLESGFCLHSCEQIPVEEIIRGRAFALTMNAKLVHRFLQCPDKRRQFEKIVDEHALEHLADLRLLSQNGSFRDLCGFV